MRGAPVSPRDPPATSTCPLENFVPAGVRRGSSSSTSGAIRPIALSAGAPRGMPMSLTTTSPACALPGRIHRPGLAAWNVTVTAAYTASPDTAPVDASTPLGTSTLTTGAPAPLSCAIASATAPRAAPSNPVPSSASTSTLARASVSGAKLSATGAGPRRRSRLTRASPPISSAAAVSRTATSRPASRSRRATTSPSPPLLPLPHTTATAPSGTSRSTARATPAPARSIRSRLGTPRSSIAQRSIARIVGASGRGLSHAGSDCTSCDARWSARAGARLRSPAGPQRGRARGRYSTVTVLARLRG